MALDKATLKAEIKSALKHEQNEKEDPNKSLERLAAKLSNAIDKYVKTGIVNTTGSATAQTGKIT